MTAVDTVAPERTGGHDETAVVSALSPAQRGQYWVLVALWAAVSLYFWVWWLRPSQMGDPLLYVGVSLCLAYGFTVLPSFYLFYLGHMKVPVHVPVDSLPPGVLGQVAVITLTVPGSESIEIVRRQLAALAGITHPHDSWILVDKEHSPEIEAMAAEHGVSYFSRHDRARWGADRVEAWNRPGPPFQAKTKAGNVNAWLDAYGERYSHFTQLDIDHNPRSDYLDRVLGFFGNPEVAYVQAPSIYGNHQHWAARGSAEQEFVLQGPLQMGFFGFCRQPFIIGSHCTYDMAAIREIGGFQPTRAEDHLDTVVLASRGYQGVFLPEVIAVGDGPETFGTYLAQQFAWAFSMIQVLFSHTPRLIRHYSPRQGLQFLFVQTWYTLWSLTTLALFLSPIVSLALDRPISGVSFAGYLLHSLPPAIMATVIWLWSRRWQHPRHLRLSWRGVALHMARWVAVLSALVQVLLRVRKPYMITVKGLSPSGVPRFRVAEVVPYIVLTLLPVATCWYFLAATGTSRNQGMLFFALENALLFALLIALVVGQDTVSLVRSGLDWSVSLRARAGAVLGATAVMALVVATTVAAAPLIWQAVTAR